MSKFLTKEQILGLDDLPIEEMYVSQWKTSVRLRTPSSRERDNFEKDIFGTTKNLNDVAVQVNRLDNFRAKLVALVLVDENGKRMFNDPKEVIELGKKSAAAMDAIFGRAQKICGITKEDVEDMTKNLKSQAKI